MISTRTRAKRHITDVLFTLTLFAVFAAASLIIVFIGAEVYSATISRADTSFEVNSTLSFVTTKIRQHDTMDAVRLDYISETPALVLTQAISEAYFETWIYHHDGILRELFINRENVGALWLGAGQALVNVHYFSFSMPVEGLIMMLAGSEDGTHARAFVSLSSGRMYGERSERELSEHFCKAKV